MTLFYHAGKTYDNEEDFCNAVKAWPDEPVDLEEFEHQLKLRLKEVKMNAEARGGALTNRQAYQILRLSTDWAVKDE